MTSTFQRAFLAVQKRFFKTEQDRIFDRWFADKGDATHRLSYDLGPKSVVFDLGGYKGEWAKQIHDRYKSEIYVFEPVRPFAQGIADLFRSSPEVHVFEYGLGAQELTTQIFMDENATSLFSRADSLLASKSKSPKEPIRIRPYADFVRENDINWIDLMKINIEGAEFDLLTHILDQGLASRVRDFQIQFHNFFPEAPRRRDEIRTRLSQTHTTTYDYPFVWENWRLKQT